MMRDSTWKQQKSSRLSHQADNSKVDVQKERKKEKNPTRANVFAVATLLCSEDVCLLGATMVRPQVP